MLRVCCRRPPEGHDAIADEFVQRPILLDQDVRHQSKIEVDDVQRLFGMFIVTFLGRFAGQIVFAHKFVSAFLALVG